MERTIGELTNKELWQALAAHCKSWKNLISFANSAFKAATTGSIAESTLANYKKGLRNLPTEEQKTIFRKKLGIRSEHLEQPQAYFEAIRPKNIGVCDRYKVRFDKFLEDAIDETFRYYIEPSRGQEVNQKWKEILIAYTLYKTLDDEIRQERKNRRGAPPKAHLHLFIKFLNLILRTLKVNRKRSHNRLAAMQSFLRGYLGIKEDIESIRQDLYR